MIMFNTDNFKLQRAMDHIQKKGYLFYPHQETGVKWMLNKERHNTGALLADDMGLGKTIQIIGMIVGNPLKTTLLVVPSSLIKQWETEIKKFSDIHVEINGIDNICLKGEINVIITSYHKLKKIDRKLEINRIICDEAHFFRNQKSVTFELLGKITTNLRWAITGTPIQNYVSDIKTLFMYIGIEDELEEVIDIYMLRRTKDDIDEIPKIKVKNIISFVDIKNDDEEYYDSVNTCDIHHLEKSLRLRQICVTPNSIKHTLKKKYNIQNEKVLTHIKLDRIVTSIKKKKTEKPIIFTYFRTEIVYLYQKLNRFFKVGMIHGSVPHYERQEIISNQDYQVLIIQINAGGTGLNLQHFNTIYFTSPQWNPAIESQAIARVDRIGQKDVVNVRRFILGSLSKYTVEKRILEIQKLKKKIIDKYINKI